MVYAQHTYVATGCRLEGHDVCNVLFAINISLFWWEQYTYVATGCMLEAHDVCNVLFTINKPVLVGTSFCSL
jgi:hypothetical protein